MALPGGHGTVPYLAGRAQRRIQRTDGLLLASAGRGRDLSYSFTSTGCTLTPTDTDPHANVVHGRVTDAAGNGVAGVRIIVRVGQSDALQIVGTTDAQGYYSGTVWIPDRIMVKVWPEGTQSYVPEAVSFYHTYGLENRQADFQVVSAGRQQRES